MLVQGASNKVQTSFDFVKQDFKNVHDREQNLWTFHKMSETLWNETFCEVKKNFMG